MPTRHQYSEFQNPISFDVQQAQAGTVPYFNSQDIQSWQVRCQSLEGAPMPYLPIGTIVKISDRLQNFRNSSPSISDEMLVYQGQYAIISRVPNPQEGRRWYRITADGYNHSWSADYFSAVLNPFAVGDSIEISQSAGELCVTEMIQYLGKRAFIIKIEGTNQFRLDIDAGKNIWGIQYFDMITLVRADKELPHALKRKKYQILQGWELECNNVGIMFDNNSESEFKKHKININEHGISLHNDGSVSGRSLEFILDKPLTCSKSLEALRWFMETYPPKIDKSCGLHFHFSVHELMESGEIMPLRVIEKSRFVNNLFALCSMYEDQLFSLFPETRQHNSYCCRFREKYSINNANVREKLGYISNSKTGNTKRYCWLNVVEMYREGGHGTVEFRILGDTNKIEYIVNVALMFQYLVKQSLLLNIQRNPDKLNEINRTLRDPYFREVASMKNATGLADDYKKTYINNVIAEAEKMQVFSGHRLRGGI